MPWSREIAAMQENARRTLLRQGKITPVNDGWAALASREAGDDAFVNPANGYRESVNTPCLWCLLFGCFYFAAKGCWGHAALAFLLALPTSGLSWLVYPFFAGDIVRRSYLRRGWVPAGQWQGR